MKIFTVKSSGLGLGDRWDAGFHEVNNRLSEKVQTIKDNGVCSEQDILADVNALPISALQVLKPLSRRNVDHVNRALANIITKEYPFLVAALLIEQSQEITKPMKEKIARLQSELDSFERFTQLIESSSTKKDRPKN